METKKSNVKEHQSKSTPTTSSVKSKKKMPLESKKKLVCKKPKSIKSKAKQVKSDNPRKSESSKRKRVTCNDMYDDVEAKFSVLERAERVLSSLEDEHPSFIKCMLPSNVAHGFWLHLPKVFCEYHLPSHDSAIMLVDEWGNEYKTTYLLERHGLSAGWRAFSISHRLLKGDLLIFRLTEPCKLKVHIVRVNHRDVVDAALCLMNLNDYEKTSNPDNRKRKRTTKFVKPYLEGVRICKPDSCHAVDQSKHHTKDSVLEVPGGPNIRTTFLHDHPHGAVTCS